ncbi:MAG: lytic transglycosylase domain-containing protein [Actinomycetota bacterium]
MRSFLRASLVTLLLSTAAMPAFAANAQGEEYFKVRERAQVVTSFTSEQVQTQPDLFVGKLLEVRGTVSAIAGSDSQTTLLIATPAGGSPTMVMLPPDKRLSDWPFLDVGIGVRMLCQIVKIGGSSSGSLEVAVPVKEYEASVVEQARAKAEAAKKAALAARQQRKPTALASRGVSANAYRPGAAAARYTDAQLVEIYGNAVRYFNRRLAVGDAQKIAAIIINYSRKYGLDARLVMSVIAVESNFNQNAVSPVGAMGLGQLMPGTASDLGVSNAYDAKANLEGSTRLLSRHIQNMTADGRPTEEAIKLALACYNAGAGAVKKYKGIPPYRETQNYVKKITRLYRQMCGLS